MCKCKKCGLELEDKMDGTYCLYAGKVCEGTEKKGRPLKGEKPKSRVITFRITDEEFDELNNLCENVGSSKSDIMYNALKLYNNLVVKR